MTDLSLVVCTRNRADQLRRTLEKIAKIESSRIWELVLVENACTDHTSEVVSNFMEGTSLHVQRVVEPEPGKGNALNSGCETAAGEIIALTDDDCYPEPDYVDAVMTVFESRDVGFLGGRVLRYDRSDADFSVRKGAKSELLPAHTFPKTGFIIGANMAFRREVFRSIGGYDEMMGAGTSFVCADIEFCARASDRGWRGGYFPQPTVYHHHGRKPGRDVAELHEVYDWGRGAYYAKTLLDLPTLRRQCLKWWYWDLKIARPGQTRREVFGALSYLARRAASGLAELLP